MATCEGSGRWYSREQFKRDGIIKCPVCDVVTGVNRHDKIKQHQQGVAPRVQTRGSGETY